MFLSAHPDWEKSAVFLQQKSGKFLKTAQPGLEADTNFEYVASCVADVNNDGFPDLVIANGGNEFYGNDEQLRPRIYFNDGKGIFTRDETAFDSLYVNATYHVSLDFNGDGYPDLFIGGRSVPFNYGQIPRSYLLLNNGKGKIYRCNRSSGSRPSHIGFVTNAIWFDINQDGQKDLIVSLEWGGIVAFINHKGSFEKKELTDKKGWWNFILPVDLNHDGQIDLIAGNLGLNSRLKASEKEPVRLYYYDFDGNGKKDQILSYYLEGRELPFANKEELEKQMPGSKKEIFICRRFCESQLYRYFFTGRPGKSGCIYGELFFQCDIDEPGQFKIRSRCHALAGAIIFIPGCRGRGCKRGQFTGYSACRKLL